MRFHVDFNNGYLPIDFDEGAYGLTPVELKVVDGSYASNLRSLMAYIKTLKYAFTGVANRVTGTIQGLSVEKSWSGSIVKNGDDVSWNFVTDMHHTVIYDISADEIEEDMYVAKSVSMSGSKVVPNWSKDLITPKNKTSKEYLISAIESFASTIPDYTLMWDKGLVLYDELGEQVKIDDVPDDDMYMLLKMIRIICFKGKHLGIFFINCKGIRPHVLTCLLKFLKGVYGDTFVFLYNCDSNVEYPAKFEITLPNIYK